MAALSYKNFEGQVMAIVKDIRERLAVLTDTNTFDFHIKASGRVNDGDVEIKFTLGTLYGSNHCEGGQLFAVVEEYMRRHGWNKAHAPLCLPSVESKEPVE